MEGRVEFEGEVPIPLGNLALYRRIYTLEQWLRRIVMAALMSRYGTQWRSAIPTEVSKGLKTRRDQLRERMYLDVEASDNVIWLLTLEELRQLLLAEYLWPSVKELTRFQKADASSRINELREIRNVVGHNRATTAQTLRIFEGIELYLGRGVDRFRRETLYEEASEIFHADPDDPLSMAVQALWDGKKRQVFLQRSEKFNSIASLPVPPFTLISVPDLVEAFHPVRHVVLALYVSSTHNEFFVVWPRGALAAEHEAVVECFSSYSHYTEVAYADQDAKYVCDPRVWFYVDALRGSPSYGHTVR